LVPLGGDLYQATLPAAGCEDTPEYYFSAEGTESGVVNQPPAAPVDTFVAEVGDFVPFWSEELDTDPGWTTEEQWAYGQPTGEGGGSGSGGPDPTSGYTGPNVYGYNLDGDYPSLLPEKHLTSTAIDCTGRHRVRLDFWRWLGVQMPSGSHAYVRVSNNGTDWVTVWENEEEIADWSWTKVELDISAVADDQPTVYLRWTMGPTGLGRTYCGWNIDDIRLMAFVCQEGILGDLDNDGDVDLADFADFAACLTGPDAGLDEGCQLADFDHDNDVDLHDFAAFAGVCLGG
jgi:hypothetical protein